MRSIDISIDVYAALWAARQPGESDEETILRRLLGISTMEKKGEKEPEPSIGFRDARFNVELPENFEIFRVYKGTEYRARATNGQLELLSTKKRYPSLNQLSRAVTHKVENAWRNWYFIGRDGNRHLLEGLRADASRSVRRQL